MAFTMQSSVQMRASAKQQQGQQRRMAVQPLSGSRIAVPARTVASVRVAVPASRATAVKVYSSFAVADKPTYANPERLEKLNQKPTVIITGASSGLGLYGAKAMAEKGWHVVMACRDFSKAQTVAQKVGMHRDTYTIMHLDLASLESVRVFAKNFLDSGLRLDALVCNAAVYLPTATEPTYTADGIEMSVGVNHLGHFLLVHLLLEKLKQAPNKDPRCIIVGSITGNTNTLAGNIPPKADLGDLSGLANRNSMCDAGIFDGAKAYKDAKVCNMLTMRQLHNRLHESSGVVFSSLYPGCIAETGLFRNHVPLFKGLFPVFQKYVTKGYVSEADAGKRLAQAVADPCTKRSGQYWSWQTGSTSDVFPNQLSEESSDDAKGSKLWDISMALTGLAPPL